MNVGGIGKARNKLNTSYNRDGREEEDMAIAGPDGWRGAEVY